MKAALCDTRFSLFSLCLVHLSDLTILLFPPMLIIANCFMGTSEAGNDLGS